MGKLFGTDGVRGIANSELTASLAYELGQAGAQVLTSTHRPSIVIGKDTRISGDMLENALTAGVLSMGGDVIKVGVIPTPGIAFLAQKYEADAGVVISASHNPFEYNGIKFFNSKGYKLDDEIEDKIEKIILNTDNKNGKPASITGELLGRESNAEENAFNLYTDYLKGTVSDADFTKMKIALDCANGAAYKVATKVFAELGAEVVSIGCEPDGININDKVGSTHPEKLQELVKREKCDIGLAFDGDADRLIAVDEKGRLIDGDKIMYICAKELKDKGLLAKNLITATVMSNMGLGLALKTAGCELQQATVGDRYVLEMMQKTGCIIGGEQSGHIIRLDYSTTGDGVLAGLQLIMAIEHLGGKPSELADEVTIYPQVLKNAKVKNENKRSFLDDKEVKGRIESIEAQMQGEGRVLIRPSGTEPLVRVMIEGKDQNMIDELAVSLAELIEKRLG